MTNYNSIDYLLDFNINKFYELIIYRNKQILEEKIYNRWIIGGYDKQMSLDEFKNKLTGKEIKNNNDKKLTAKDYARFNRLDV